MKSAKKEVVSDIHHTASEIQRLAYLMMANNRVGQEWLLNMKHASERLDLLIGRINQ